MHHKIVIYIVFIHSTFFASHISVATNCYIPKMQDACNQTLNVCQDDYKYNGSRREALKDSFDGQSNSKNNALYFLLDSKLFYRDPDRLESDIKSFFGSLETLLKSLESSYVQIFCYSFNRDGFVTPVWNTTTPGNIASLDACYASIKMYTNISFNDKPKLENAVKNFYNNFFKSSSQLYNKKLWILSDAVIAKDTKINYADSLAATRETYLQNWKVFTVSVGQCPQGVFDAPLFELAMHALSTCREGYSACLEMWINDFTSYAKNKSDTITNCNDTVFCGNANKPLPGPGVIAGEIAGAVIGSLLGFLLLVLIISLTCYCCYRKRNGKVYGCECLKFYCSFSWCFRPKPPIPRVPHPPAHPNDLDIKRPRDYENSAKTNKYRERKTQMPPSWSQSNLTITIIEEEEDIVGRWREPSSSGSPDSGPPVEYRDATVGGSTFGRDQAETRESVSTRPIAVIKPKPAGNGAIKRSRSKLPKLPSVKPKPIILDHKMNGWGEYLKGQAEQKNLEFVSCYNIAQKSKMFARSGTEFSLNDREIDILVKLFSSSAKEEKIFENKIISKTKVRTPKNPPTISSANTTIPKPNVFVSGNKFRINEITPNFISASAFLEDREIPKRGKQPKKRYDQDDDDEDDESDYKREYFVYVVSNKEWLVLAVLTPPASPSHSLEIKHLLNDILKSLGAP